MGEQQPAGWTYHLPDALGSVRQLTDADAEVILARAYEPFGSVMASNGSGETNYSFTGEWADGTGLVHLRARYYSPRNGRFSTHDLWKGDIYQPISFNAWLYAISNPVNVLDPSGLRPEGLYEIDDILENPEAGYQYSCNCGWIDWGHAISQMETGESLAQRIYRKLDATINWSQYPLWTGNRGVQVTSYVGNQLITIPIVQDTAVIQERYLSGNKTSIAAGIFIEHSEKVERIHKIFQDLGVGQSGFAEEDLPSDMIGFYIATRMRQGTPLKVVIKEVTEVCKTLNRVESRSIYKYEYAYGDNFITGWKRWDARLFPISRTCTECDVNRRWPYEFSRIVNQSLHSNRGSYWWWYKNPWEDGNRAATVVDGVYALVKGRYMP